MPESMAHAEPTDAIRRSSHLRKSTAFLCDFGLRSIGNTEQKHQKEESEQSQPSTTPKSQSADLGTSASASVARKKLHVDWPQHFCSGTSTSVDYDKLDLAGFVAGYLARIKTYEPETFKFMLSHIEPLMLKGISYTQSSVRSFHANIKKQVELYRLEWNDAADICDHASTFL